MRVLRSTAALFGVAAECSSLSSYTESRRPYHLRENLTIHSVRSV
jgi:hypothetical protein